MGAANLAFLFRLLVSHFLADFPLQPNELIIIDVSGERGWERINLSTEIPKEAEQG